MTPNELIKRGSNFLKQNNIKTYLIDSELIFSSVSGQKREKFLLDPNFELNSKQIRLYNNLISRRALAREPIAYLLKNKEFWSIKFNVDKDVLIPRPETEILVEELVKHFKNCKPLILDIGTGSGCIIISLLQELKKSQGIAIDISIKALSMAKRNSKINNTFGRIKFINTSISKFNHFKFDLIVSNPPYLSISEYKKTSISVKKFDPKIALLGGIDGLLFYKYFSKKIPKIMKKNSYLILEIGETQGSKCIELLSKSGLKLIKKSKDLQKKDRILVFSKV